MPAWPNQLAALGFVALDAGIRVVRFRTMVPVPLLRAVAVTVCGDAAAAVTPARVGGDTMRFLGFRRSGASRATLLAAFATEIAADAAVITAGSLLLATLLGGAGRAWLRRLMSAAPSPAFALAVAAAIAASAVAVPVLLRAARRLGARLDVSPAEIWRLLSRRPSRTVAAVLALSVVSWTARAAVLPALAAGTPHTSSLGLLAGSAALLVGQTLLPTPSGAGATDLAFVAGFARVLPAGQVAALLVVWRFYTVALAVVVGGALIAHEAWRVRRRGPCAPPLVTEVQAPPSVTDT